MLRNSIKKVLASALVLAMTVGAVQFGGFALKTVNAEPTNLKINLGTFSDPNSGNNWANNGENGNITFDAPAGWDNELDYVKTNQQYVKVYPNSYLIPGSIVDSVEITQGMAEAHYAQITAGVTNPAPMEAYQSAMHFQGDGKFVDFEIPAENGDYTVRFHIFNQEAESWFASNRNGAVEIYGTQAFDSYGIGYDGTKVVIVEKPVTVVNSMLEISVNGWTWGFPIAAIELVPVAPAATPEPIEPGQIIKINCGAGHNGTALNPMPGSVDGTIGGSWKNQATATIKNIVSGWLPDDSFIDSNSANEVFYIQNFVTDLTVANAAPQGIYDSMIQAIDPLNYIVPVGIAGAEYTVRLHFGWSGLTWKDDGEGAHRNTLVSVTGGTDVHVAGGDNDVFNNTAIVRETTAVADANGEITVTISRSYDCDWGAIINGIELIPVESDPATEAPATLEPTEEPTEAPATDVPAPEAIKINCGSAWDGTNWSNGVVTTGTNFVAGWDGEGGYVSDQPMQSVSVYGGYAEGDVNLSGLTNSAPWEVYSSASYISGTPITYTIPVENGDYTVRLHVFGGSTENVGNGMHNGSFEINGENINLVGNVNYDGSVPVIFEQNVTVVNSAVTVVVTGGAYGTPISGIEIVVADETEPEPSDEPTEEPTVPTDEPTEEPAEPTAAPASGSLKINLGTFADSQFNWANNGENGNNTYNAPAGWTNELTYAKDNLQYVKVYGNTDLIPGSSVNVTQASAEALYAQITSGVTDPAPMEVYQSAMHFNGNGNFVNLKIPVANGDYTIRFHVFNQEGSAQDAVQHRQGMVFVDGNNVFSSWDTGFDGSKVVIMEAAATVTNGLIEIEVNGWDWGFPIAAIEVVAEGSDEPEATEEPTLEPTDVPTLEPTEEPTLEPTEEPTLEPTDVPTLEPTTEPEPLVVESLRIVGETYPTKTKDYKVTKAGENFDVEITYTDGSSSFLSEVGGDAAWSVTKSVGNVADYATVDGNGFATANETFFGNEYVTLRVTLEGKSARLILEMVGRSFASIRVVGTNTSITNNYPVAKGVDEVFSVIVTDFDGEETPIEETPFSAAWAVTKNFVSVVDGVVSVDELHYSTTVQYVTLKATVGNMTKNLILAVAPAKTPEQLKEVKSIKIIGVTNTPVSATGGPLEIDVQVTYVDGSTELLKDTDLMPSDVWMTGAIESVDLQVSGNVITVESLVAKTTQYATVRVTVAGKSSALILALKK